VFEFEFLTVGHRSHTIIMAYLQYERLDERHIFGVTKKNKESNYERMNCLHHCLGL